jgi:creatinine amidohydrolase/Fe(II)-dependent formamide hydrolase-like protein
MPQGVPGRAIGELTSTEIATHLNARSILCLPIGSIEQHGPHLPLNTDAVLAEELTRRIVARWAGSLDLWQLPALTIGLAREHEWAPGTLSLSVEGIIAVMRDLGRSIARALPTRNLAIINWHGGNRSILNVLIQDLRADFGLNICVLHPVIWAETMEAAPTKPDIHGGKIEASLMLAIAPHLVRIDQIAQLKTQPDADAIRKTILDPAVSWPWTTDDKRIANTGVVGEAHAASAELGQRLLDHMTEMAGAALRQLLER